MSNLSLGKLLYGLLATVVAGLMLLAYQAFESAGSVKIGSKLYTDVIQSNDLVADVLPPPQYIVEAALLVRQIRTAAPADRELLVARFKQTREEFETGQKRWLSDDMPEHLRELITNKTATPARAFYTEVEQRFMPALTAGDDAAMDESLHKLDSFYRQNRTAVEELVKLAVARKTQLESESKEKLNSYYTYFVATVLLILFVVGLLSLGVIREIRERISIILHSVSEAASGNLAVKLSAHSHDEFELLSAELNSMFLRFREIIEQLQESAHLLSAAAMQSAHISRSGVEDLHRQSDMGQQLNSGMSQMSDAIDNVSRSSSDTLDRVEHVRGASARSIENMQGYVHRVEKVARRMDSAAEKVSQLNQLSNTIGSVLDVIRGIAEQTNLLALNAAIEAARAGEQGRGFAVVADEVRTLASKTGNSTTEIQQMIERLQASTRDVVSEMHASREDANSGVADVQQVADLLRELSSSVEEIYSMNANIASSAEEQRNVTHAFESNLRSMTALNNKSLNGMKDLRDATDNLSQLAERQRSIATTFRL
uniref:methyl-accepting chemotaxis protein n=1 Tax=Cellvibrio fontiphilus TaxID=1815559 RepID=UPI002B4C1C94|nr:methyl-accepting chemotaxis protein [Cellvibrio fontiphilus]